MTEAARWTSSAVFDWTPIFTFTRRRMAVLDWFEKNVKVHAFTDDPDHAGIAIGKGYERLRFDRERLSLTLDDPRADVAKLTPALGGLWKIVEPTNVMLSRYYGSWTFALEEDYGEVAARFANRVIGGVQESERLAYDAACLVDFRTPLGFYKVEFGVVTADELVERLNYPSMGMLSTSRDDRPGIEVLPEALPATSVFMDVAGLFNAHVDSHGNLAPRVQEIESEVSGLAAAIGAAI